MSPGFNLNEILTHHNMAGIWNVAQLHKPDSRFNR